MNLLTKVLMCIVILLMLTGCNQVQQTGVTKQLSEIKTDIASGVGVVVDYVTDGERTFIVLDIDNPNQKFLEIWLNQTYLSVGAETTRKRRIITSSNKTIKQTIRASRLEDGITEVISFDVLNTNGIVLLKTEPIVNDGFQTKSKTSDNKISGI